MKIDQTLNNKEREKQHKRRVKILLMRVSLMAMLLIVSTYAWFTSQKDITLSNIRGVVEVVENMEISLDAKTWYQRIDLSDAVNVFAEAQSSRDEALEETESDTKTTALAVVPSLLLPVSGMGELNDAIMPLYIGEATSTSLSAIEECEEETIDATGKEIAKDNGYFAFDIYIKNTSRDNETDVLQLNINSSAQVLTETIKKNIIDDLGNTVERTYNGNDASGLQNTIRVALAKYEGEVSSTATQLEILNSTKAENIKDIAIWEPNAYDHVETIVANNNRLINGTDANKITFTEYHPNEPLDTYALKASAVTATKIDNVYNIADTGLGKQNTFKTDNIKNADDEVQSYRIKTANEKPIDIKNISNENFEISANTVTRYRVYVWLEGQDVDCINVASLGGGIELDLGLTKDDEVGDVLEAEGEPITTAITNDNIGDYIDLGKSIVGTTATDDDWRIFYVEDTNTDGVAEKVYAILSDYLPNSTGHAKNAGLLIGDEGGDNAYVYSIYSDVDGNDLVNKLKHETAWDSLANGKSTEVVGSPTADLLMLSYNTKNNTTLDYEDYQPLSSSTDDYDLYVPHTSSIDNCSGYWLASLYDADSVWYMVCDGNVLDSWSFGNSNKAARPVVTLTSEIKVIQENGVWKIVDEVVETIDLSLASKVIGNESAMYGKYVNYPVDIDGNATDNDWQIFYASGNDVFVIADDCVLNSLLTNGEMSPSTSSSFATYGSYFGSNQLGTTSIDKVIANKYLLRLAEEKSQNNYYATAHLLNTSVWNTYFRNTTYASSATGGPTVEMFMDSWNEKFEGNASYSKLSYAWATTDDGENSDGYKVGTTNADSFSVVVIGYNTESAKMYWPHTSYEMEDSTECYGYWLASPSAYKPSLGIATSMLSVYYDGYVSYVGSLDYHKGVRPVVSLNSGIQATQDGDTWVLATN